MVDTPEEAIKKLVRIIDQLVEIDKSLPGILQSQNKAIEELKGKIKEMEETSRKRTIYFVVGVVVLAVIMVVSLLVHWALFRNRKPKIT